jgi:antiviral helicase SLH1
MVFVHARKETVKSGEKLKEMAQTEGLLDDFSCLDHPRYDAFRREIATSKNKEMKQLFDAGIGIHHAGMLRSDRNMMERMFEANCLKASTPRKGYDESAYKMTA